MMFVKLVQISLTLVFAAATWAQPTVADLEPHLQHALEDLQRRDPATFEQLALAIQERPVEARGHLEEHARYLDELERIQEADPARYQLMMDQEQMEREARHLMETLHGAEDPDARDRITERLREHLDRWFDVRQQLRWAMADHLSTEIAQGQSELAQREHPQAQEEWIARVVEGGPEAMRQRMEHLRKQQEIRSLAPYVVRLVMSADPPRGRVLAELAERSPEEFVAALDQISREHPEVIVQARRLAEGRPSGQDEMEDAVFQAHELLLPWVRPEDPRSLALPAEVEQELTQIIDHVIELETTLTQRHLDEAEQELERQRKRIADRLERRDTIIDIQLSQMVGETDRYEW